MMAGSDMATVTPLPDVLKMMSTADMKAQLAAALPTHFSPERMLRVVRTALQLTPQLAQCDKLSLISAVVEASQMGLEPNTSLGHAYLIPFKRQVQLIFGYKGLLDLARRSGKVGMVFVEVVRENDKFKYVLGLNPTIEHIPHEAKNGGDRGALRAVYAIAQLQDGAKQFCVMWRQDVEKCKASSSAVKSGKNGPWGTHEEEMWKKTAVRRLCKMLPCSVEMRRAVALDEAAEASVPQIFNNEIFQPAAATATVEQRTEDLKQRVEAAKQPKQEAATQEVGGQ